MKLHFFLLLIPVALCKGIDIELEAISAGGLSEPTAYLTSIYDNDDSIYIFGGWNTVGKNSIYRYNVSADRSTRVGSFPTLLYSGDVVEGPTENFFYFGGQINSNPYFSQEIYEFSPNGSTIDVVGELKTAFTSGTAFKEPNSTKVFLVSGGGGTPKIVECFDIETSTSCEGGHLLRSYQYVSSFVFGGNAFLFGYPNEAVQILNLTDLTSREGPTNLPEFRTAPSVVFDGIKYAYLIGGYYNTTDQSSSGLIRFDATTFETEFIPVKNFPGSATESPLFQYSTAVFVEKLNRIYIIGGFSYPPGVFYSDIWYIDLTPLDETTEMPSTTTPNPDFVNCDNKPDGFYPHPSNCAMFFACTNGTVETFICPPPLLFNPETEGCDFPINVDCDISCVGKPDGMYPHPHSCSLFIGCFEEALEIFKCPDPLLFDPDTLTCRYPQDVQCDLSLVN